MRRRKTRHWLLNVTILMGVVGVVTALNMLTEWIVERQEVETANLERFLPPSRPLTAFPPPFPEEELFDWPMVLEVATLVSPFLIFFLTRFFGNRDVERRLAVLEGQVSSLQPPPAEDTP